MSIGNCLRCACRCVFKLTWCKLVTLLVIVIFILQYLHFILMNKLEEEVMAAKTKRLRNQLFAESQQILGLMKNSFHRKPEIIDQTGLYKIMSRIYYPQMLQQEISTSDIAFYKPHRQMPTSLITLLTQISGENIGLLQDLANNWAHPLSITIFLTREIANEAISNILRLYICSEAFRINATVHVVFPLVDNIADQIPKTLALDYTACDYQPIRRRINYSHKRIQYPNNLLRNVAKLGVKSEYIFTIDADMIPSQNLADKFREMVGNYPRLKLSKTALVVPVFEALNTFFPPVTKEALLYQLRDKTARPFYYEPCRKCQSATDYARWVANGTNFDDSKLRIMYEKQWVDPWEPFFIAPFNAPKYDERFRQYGFNRISQACEMHVAGFTFAILDNAFVVHRGFKSKFGFHKTKNTEQERNRFLFRQFKDELKSKYPASQRRC